MSDLDRVLVAVEASKNILLQEIRGVETKLADRIGKNHGRLCTLEAKQKSTDDDILEIKDNCKTTHAKPAQNRNSETPRLKRDFLSLIKYVALGGTGIGTTIYTVISLAKGL